ncbi:MAG: hypothetical protein QM765_16830 [Myxococcales bacterium]
MRILLALAIALAATPVLAAEPATEPAADKPAAAEPAPAPAPAPAKEAAAEPAKPAADQPAAAEPAKAESDKPAAAKKAEAKPDADGEASKPKGKPFDPEPIDDQARFLAGLPLPESSPLYPLTRTKFWQSYSKKFDADWEKLKAERLDSMRDWGQKVLAPKIDPKAPVYYLFGGPDFLSVPVLYPEAPVYILGGLEPVGKVPPALRAMGSGALEEDIRNLRLSLNSIIRLSFFKTNDMRDDLIRTELRGVAPLLFALVARSGAKLLDSTRVEITDAGELKELKPADKCVGVPGIRLKLQREGGPVQELLYFKHDVSDPVIKAGPGFLAFFKKHAPANTFLKAASFLLHRPKQFGLTATFLVEHSKSILQDDSGLPFELLAKGPFELTLFGKYLRPRPPFTNRGQPDMTEAFKKGPVEELPFLTGYRKTGESNLVLAVGKQGGAAAPAP